MTINCSVCKQFYIIESHLEVLARHMLFLSLIMEPPDKFGYQGWATVPSLNMHHYNITAYTCMCIRCVSVSTNI